MKRSSEIGAVKRTEASRMKNTFKYSTKFLTASWGSLRNTYKAEAEANNKVWIPDEKHGKTLLHLVKIFEQNEDVGKEMVDVDHEVEETAKLIAH